MERQEHNNGRWTVGRLDLILTRLERVEEKLDRLLGEGEPAKRVVMEEGYFSPGSGFIPSVQKPKPQRASEEFTKDALAKARQALKDSGKSSQ